MTDFILVQRNYDNVPHLIIRRVPEFLNSLAFKSLTLEDRLLPGLVCASFTKFLVTIQKEVGSKEKEEDVELLGRIYAVIEEMASDKDPAVQNVVVTEILENINTDEITRKRIVSMLLPKSKALYDRWIEV